MEILILVVAFITAFILFNIYKISTLTLYSGEMQAIRATDIPEAQTSALMNVEVCLASLGFDKICHVRRSKVVEGQDWGAYGVVYFHRKRMTYAFAAIEPMINTVQGCKLYFVNVAERDAIYETLSGSDFSPGCYPNTVHINDAMTSSYREQWASHKTFLADNQITKSARYQSRRRILELFEYVFFAGLIESGAMYSQKGTYKPRLKTAAVVFWRSFWVRRKLSAQQKNTPGPEKPAKESIPSSSSQQLEAYKTYRQIQDGNKIGSYTKIFLLLGSVILFAASFGLGFGLSFETLGLLIIVLFIHELGHLLGMWVFGYQDLKMLFVPFLGALATGKKEVVKPWQEAIVLILGPLPGYILGAVLLFSSSNDLPNWAYQYAVLSLILNGINLLPFMPLDGGRLVNLGLFNKLPYFQLCFYILSIAFFFLIGITFDEKVGYILSVLLLIGLPSLWNEVTLLRTLLQKKIHKNTINLQGIIDVVDKQSIWQKMAPQNRWAILDSLVYRIQHAKAGVFVCTGILCLWLCSIILPVYLSLDEEKRLLISSFYSILASEDMMGASIEEIEEQYKTTTQTEDKITYLTQLTALLATDNIERGTQYWNEFMAIGNDATLSAELQELAQVGLARVCNLYEQEDCIENHYRTLAMMRSKPELLTSQRIEALHYLAQNTNEETAKRALYLDEVSLNTTNMANPDLLPSTLSRQAEIYYSLGMIDQAIAAGTTAITASTQHAPDITHYYLKELINVYFHQKRYQSANTLLHEWSTKLVDENPDNSYLQENLVYLKVQVLAQIDVKASIKILESISPATITQKVEIGLARIYLDTLQEIDSSADVFQNILDQTQSLEEYELLEIASNLSNPTNNIDGLRHTESGRLAIDEHWYWQLKTALQAKQLSSLRDAIENVDLSDY